MSFEELLDREITVRFTIRTVVLIAVFSPLPILVLWFIPWGASSAPAWVQALGSIGAISVAAWAALHASWSNRNAVEKAARERTDVVTRALSELALRGNASVKMLVDSGKSADPHACHGTAKFVIQRMQKELDVAKEIKLIDMPSADHIKHLLELLVFLEEGITCATRFRDQGSFMVNRKIADDLHSRFEELQVALQAL